MRWDTPRPSSTRPIWDLQGRRPRLVGTLFEAAATGTLFDVILANRADLLDHGERVDSLTLGGFSPEDLMLAWLNELIFRSETRHRFYGRFSVDGR